MGTRHLVCVYANKRFQAAQYGQFDGDPGGTGIDVLDFIRTLDPKKMDIFKKKLRNIRLHSEKEFQDKNLYDTPKHHQPTAHELLQYIFDSEDEIHLVNSVAFAGDSLYCEWVYLLDLDKKTFNVYKGFVEVESESAELFMKYKLPPKKKNPNYAVTDYYPVKLVASYGLESLPETEDFVERFKEEEDV